MRHAISNKIIRKDECAILNILKTGLHVCRYRVMAFTGFLLLFLEACGALGAGEAARKQAPSQEQQFLATAAGKIDAFTFGKADLALARKYAAAQGNRESRLPFHLVICAYYRHIENRPDRAIRVIGEHVFTKAQLASWEKDNAEKKKIALDQYQRDLSAYRAERLRYAAAAKSADADPMAASDSPVEPAEPSGLFASLPPADEWNLTVANATAAVELARCLTAGGQLENAMRAIDRIGQHFSDESRVLAAECGGDLADQMRLHDKAIDFYQYALKALAALRTEQETDSSQSVRIYSGEQRIIKARVERKLWQTRQRLEASRYGPDWVAYRDAERLRLGGEPSYLEAHLRYEDIIQQWPDSLYAEAAKCYSIKTLLALADDDAYVRSLVVVDELEKRVAVARNREETARKAKVAKAALRELDGEVQELQRRLRRLRGVPSGKRAMKTAEAALERFVAENEWGLYRGEAIAALGDYHFEVALDPVEAGRHYARAERWFMDVRKIDADLAAFAVPEQAADVAAPPGTTFALDGLGNIRNINPKIGDIVNRQSSPIYLNEQMSAVSRQLGFLAFFEGDMETARAHFDRLQETDMQVRYLKGIDGPNMHHRLVVRCQQGTLRRADPEDLRSFGNRKRLLLVSMADFFAETEQPYKAQKILRALLAGEHGKLSRNEEAYVRFGLQWALWYSGVFHGRDSEKKEAKEVLAPFLTDKLLQKAPIAPRALYSLGNMLRYSPGDGTMSANDVYRLIVQKYPKHPKAEQSLYMLGQGAIAEGDRKTGEKYLRKQLKEFPGGPFVKLSRDLLDNKEDDGDR